MKFLKQEFRGAYSPIFPMNTVVETEDSLQIFFTGRAFSFKAGKILHVIHDMNFRYEKLFFILNS
jgi:hypothetical protein